MERVCRMREVYLRSRLDRLVVVLAVGCAVLAVPARTMASERLVDAVVAAIDGTPVTLREFERFRAKRGPLLPPDQRNQEQAVFDAMILSRLFQKEFEKQNIHAEDADVELYISRVLDSSGSSREDLVNTLAKLGLEWSDYFERMREEVERAALINREIRTRVNVSPEEIERYWKTNPDFEMPERVEVAHIFLPLPDHPTSADAEELRQLAARVYKEARGSGSAFQRAAKKYSKGPSADEGGVLGVFRRGSMAPLFEKAVSKLDEGEVSEPIEARDGIHILKLVRVLPHERVPLDSVRDKIRDKLYDEQLETRFKRWIDEDLRNRHHVITLLDRVHELGDM